MKKKLYKIRKKSNGEFISLGYNNKSTWLSYPSEAINIHLKDDKIDYEVVVFNLVEAETQPLR